MPDGFVLIEGLPTVLAARSSESFTIQLDTRNVGFFFGTVTLENNDPNEPLFRFDIAGEVS